MPSVAVAVIASINDEEEEEEAEEEVLWWVGLLARRSRVRGEASRVISAAAEEEAEALLAAGLGDARCRCSNEARGAVCTRSGMIVGEEEDDDNV